MKTPAATFVAAVTACALGRTAGAVVAKVASAPRPAAAAVALVASRPKKHDDEPMDERARDAAEDQKETHFGDTSCPCIGFDNIAGETIVQFPAGTGVKALPMMGSPSPAPYDGSMGYGPSPAAAEGGMVQVSYDADLGSHCHAWDAGKHPLCKGDPITDPDWCGQSWCFIDPCKCNFRDLPVKSEYVPDARYRGSPLFYSYETCGSRNTFNKNLPDFGSPRCRCVGLHDVPGKTEVLLDTREWGGKKEVVEYPGDMGTACRAWDKDVHPLCKTKNPPAFCNQKWCYVDPCECDMLDIPKVSLYLPKASHSGKHLYYNYDTCGSKDYFTKKYNKGACFNQRTQQGCEAMLKPNGEAKCGWTGSHCLGFEMLNNPLCKRVAMKYGKRFHRVQSAAASRHVVLPAAAAVVAAAMAM